MEVVAATPNSGGVPPFHDHDVREWSRIDSLTGALERARLETDHWTANTNNSCHKYGKVVDSRARTDADGALQQQARRQLEVYHSQIPGGHLQVIKTHTVSSSRWTNKNSTNGGAPNVLKDFENLQLSLNPLDLSSQKSKATVGRSVSRRPPSRQRSRNEPSSNTTNPNHPLRNAHLTAATNLHRVSRLCHQIHDSAVKQAFGKPSPRLSIQERQNGDGSVEIYDLESESDSKINGHSNLLRTKSTSSEDIHLLTPEKDSSSTKSIEDLEDLEQLQNWRRTSKIRRSLQFPKQQKPTVTKPLDLPENSVSVRKIREDLEKGRRLNTALRGNTVDLEALDQILQSISSSSSIHSDKTIDDNFDDSESDQLLSTKKQKRNSFVTVESLQEVRGRLRRTSSPSIDIYQSSKEEETDDGIVTEEINSSNLLTNEMPEKASNAQSRVRSYVYGMEAMLNKTTNLGTNSLESRTKLVNGNSNNRSEDWYNRRKSYGFEQVHGHEEPSNSISLKDKNMVESSTDSGICRSTEIVVVPTATKTNNHYDYSSDGNSDSEPKSNGYDRNKFGNVRKMTNIFSQEETSNMYKRANDWKSKNEIKSTTITIPISKNNNIVDLPWNDEPEKEIKRHSIAVDESKYVFKSDETKYRRTSLVTSDYSKQTFNQDLDDDSFANGRRTKKVEFCKTEVHFAADSGKVNIVETDEKPPPTNNFRRRRRNSGPLGALGDFNKNGLPVLHFGDSSYEKNLFGLTDEEASEDTILDNDINIYENLQPSKTTPAFGIVTVNTNYNNLDYQEEEKKHLMEIENIKGILKNKPIKPRPYHLGESMPLKENLSDDDGNKWGVRLRHVQKEETPVWKSTVTVHSFYDKPNIEPRDSSNEDEQPEFQKLLKNLRPTRKSDFSSDSEHRYSDNFSSIRVVPAAKDNRRSSWSVADKVKYVEDNQSGAENKGYSTKVNFGDGEATVVESDSYIEKDWNTTTPRMENLSKDSKSKQLLNKGLVVRIGREDSASNHTVCSKMTTTRDTNNTTTTTKITIDLSPSPPITKFEKAPVFSYAKYSRSQNHSFKSTSLILNTLKDRSDTKTSTDDSKKETNKIPQQLEALKKLYDNDQSDSDADKEVQLLMSKITEDDLSQIENDNSSIVSGSWSKMRAYNAINKTVGGVTSRKNTNEIKSRLDLTSKKQVEKDASTTSQDRLKLIEEPQKLSNGRTDNKYTSNLTRHKYSPVALRKTIPVINRTDLTTEKLSSPALVGKNSSNYEYPEKLKPINGRNSPTKDFKQTKTRNEMVLRQPKKSEMTYFGVKVSPRPFKKQPEAVTNKENKLSENKPDLLQHYNKPPTTNSIGKPRRKSPEPKKPEPPIYENLTHSNPENKGKYSREFDRSILDELTKAADQILQAVNGYTDEDSHNRLSTDEEDTKKRNIINQQLDTISETKSWRQDKHITSKSKPPNIKPKLKHTSSTSSVESFSKDKRNTTPDRKTTPVKSSSVEKQKKKVASSESVSVKATTKARRLQRASSREALLQSHGSSSEDLSIPIEAPVRKPRLVKKTKASQFTMTNGLEISKKSPVTTSTSTNRRKKEEVRSEEKILGSLPEIRHKTAVSTIRSTAEKCTRDRSRHKTEEVKKKTPQKRESSSRAVNSSRTDKSRSTSAATNKETVTHRISTANIKKCHRSEAVGTKH